MGLLKYKGYQGSVEFSPADNCFYGKVLGLKGTLISYEGTTVDGIRQDFEEAVDYYIESCRRRGIEPAKPYSGRFLLRMSSELHSDLAAAAASNGTTINDFVNITLYRALHQA
ncbi:MAG: type II toxin-antitoxin system HicB family antitoxin [Bacteroides sp.]|nr:type II toxin-antitoxin system HicB family antitoxin [Bacteroidales bacterium]MBD5326434.1 type II toxin-antitoxin system HicB family antitoxin [Bacteroides sp.]MBD5327380.1 type II toxin-antitoxin system HicB family antitoxin [Bacteroides sp.]